MKKFLILLSLVIVAALQPAEAQYSRGMNRHHSYSRGRSYADLVEVSLREPGTLEESMPKGMYDRVRMLCVEGPLNERDLAYITKLAKRSKVYDEDGKSISNYLDVDLEYASVMERYGSRINHDVLPRRAFEYASRLRSIVLPDRLKSIGDRAFGSCYDLEEVLMPSRVTELGDHAFEGCDDLKYITLPARLERIGEQCFKGCSSLTRLDLPSGLLSVGKEAFDGTYLTELYIPARCEIDNDHPGRLPQLRRFEVDDRNNAYCSVDGTLYDRDCRVLLQYPAARTGRCRVPDGVEEIVARAFYNSKVSDVELPESLTRLGHSAFSGCSSMRSIVLQGSLSKIPVAAFEDCKSLEEIELPASVTRIEERAFHECNSLRTLLCDPGQLRQVDKQAFDRCYALTTLDLSNVIVIEEKTCYECKSLRSVQLSDQLTRIGKEAFRRCQSLMQFALPSTVSAIDKEAFRECTSLNEITLNEGLLTLGDNALRETAIRYLVIPSTVTKLGKKVAEKCSQLQRIECHAITPPELSGESNSKIELYVPAQSVSSYQGAKNWKKFKVIKGL